MKAASQHVKAVVQGGAYMALRSFSPFCHSSHQLCITLFRNKYLSQNIYSGKVWSKGCSALNWKKKTLSQQLPLLLEIIEYKQHNGTYRQSDSKPKPWKHQQISNQWHIPNISLLLYFKRHTVRKGKKNSTKTISKHLYKLSCVRRKRIKA